MEPMELAAAVVKIIWINVLLSGDNAVVIALACRSLHGYRRRLGITLGAGAAVVLRIILTAVVAKMLEIPYLKLIGGLALVWIAIKLVMPEQEEDDPVHGHDTLWRAVGTVVVADLIMSLDNVLAIAAAAQNNDLLIILGLAISVPIVIGGSTIIMAAIAKMPLLVWAGAAILGWTAGELIAKDELYHTVVPHVLPEQLAAVVGALLVVGVGYFMSRRRPALESEADPH